MKTFVKIVYIFLAFVFLLYLTIPSTVFPKPPPDSIQSGEPADTEDPNRRAYFTDYTREEVISFYKVQVGLSLPAFLLLRLNYSPEDAQGIIRDQTRSTFLEELTYPLRDSLYINGFEPKEAKDVIWYKGKYYRQKITIKYVQNGVVPRVTIALGTIALSWFLFKQYLSGV